ncbi:hypothetical protein [Oceanobacillus halotolerans]|uniref:hypothetical protein n=1 Tax=Oceanobacillus halotolerans TaxID=2663380 RepID=UPI0013DB29AB|nr:hypothetical protein [Oceanobacillus halotolerans]
MQVALPRTQDAGKLQENMAKQNQHFQESLAQSQLKQDLNNKKRVTKFEDITKARIKKEEKRHSSIPDEEQDNQTDQESDQYLKHPFLGNQIDYNG